MRESLLFVALAAAFVVAAVASAGLMAFCFFLLAVVALGRVLAAVHAWRASDPRETETSR
jgi:membrane protein implicated in regulation of membrane protease activity